MNTKEYDFGQFETDDFGFDDPFDEPSSPKKDRSPVEDVAKGAYAGFKETVTDTSFQTNVLRKALPEGYGAAFDTATDVTDKGIGLYNQVTNDLRPAIIDLKRMGRRAKGMVNGVLPDAVSTKLDEILAEEKQVNSAVSKDEIRQQSIAAELAPIFEAQAEEKREDKTQDLLKQVVESKRHETTLQVSQGIRDELTKQNAYQDTVTMKWQRKTLELKLKHFFVAKDHFELFKLTQNETLTHFRSLVKNTGLPEAVKIKNSELALQLTKERLVGKAQDKFAPMARDFLNSFAGNLGKRLKEKVDEFKDAVSTASFAGDMLEGIDLEELGISKTELGAQMGAESGTRKAGEWLGKKFAPLIAKNKKVKTLSNKLLYGSENYTKILREVLENKTFTSGPMNMLQEAALDALRNRRESKVGYDEIANSTEHADFDNITRKSIVEVIPGWLSKIWHGMTGRKEGEVTFDHRSNQFMGTEELARGIEAEAVRGTDLDRLKEINKEIVGQITDKELDSETTSKLEEMLLKFARDDREFDVTKFVNGEYLNKSGLSNQQYDDLADSIHDKLGLELDGKIGNENVTASLAQVEANRGLRRLRETLPNTYEIANLYANTANRDALRGTGITESRDGIDHVNEDYLLDRYREHNTKQDRMNKPFNPVSEAKPWATGTVENSYTSTIESEQIVESIDKLIATLEARSSDTSKIDIDYDRLEQMQEAYSSVTQSEKQITLLNEIREVLLELPSQIGWRAPGSIDGIKEWGRKKYRGAKSLLGKAYDYTIKKPWEMGKKLLGNPFSQVKKLGELGSKAWSKITGLKPMDLFLPDDLINPVIEKKKLLEGYYLDAVTGKVIKSLDDIKGAVKNIDGDWVIRPEQFKKGLVDSLGKKVDLGSLASYVTDWAKKLNPLKYMKGFNPLKPLKMLNPMPLFKGLIDQYRRLPAVYVKGEKVARFLPAEVEQGIITNAKGTVVKTARHLNSAIFKNGEEIIKETELKYLVDENGKKIKGLTGKILDGIGSAFNMMKGAGKAAFNLVKKGAGKAADVMQGSVGWLASKLPGLDGISVGSTYTKRIYSLLLKYFSFKGLDVSEEQLSLGKGLGTKLSEGFDKLKSKFSKPNLDKAKDTLKSKYDKAKESLTPKYDKAKETLKPKYDKAKDKAADIKDAILSFKGDGFFNRMKDFFLRTKEKAKPKGLKERLKGEADDIRDRVGSYANIMKERLAKRKAAKGAKKEPAKKKDKKSSGFFGKILGMLGNSVGILGTIASGVLGLGKFAGMIAKHLLGTGFLKAAATTAARAIPAVVSGVAAATPAIVSGLATAGSVAAGAASTVAAVVLSPAFLVGAAVAGVGYLTYKYLDEKKDDMTKLRMAQYGIPDIEHDLCEQVFNLEQLLKPHTQVSEKGASVTGNIPYERIPEIFGFDLDNKLKVKQFNEWFAKRFKPVYLKNMTLLKALGNSNDLSLVEEKVKGKYRVEFAKASMIKDLPGPYRVNANPFADQEIKMTTDMVQIEKYLAIVIENNRVDNLGMGTHISDARNGRDSRVKQKKTPTHDLPDDGYSAAYGKDLVAKGRGEPSTNLATEGKTEPSTNLTASEKFAEMAAERRRNSDNPKVRAMQRQVDEMRKRNAESTVSQSQRMPANEPYLAGETTKTQSDKEIDAKLANLGFLDGRSIYKPKRATMGEYAKMVVSVAEIAGISPEPILQLAKLATNFNPAKRIGARSGMYLMDAASFRRLMDKHAADYEIKNPDILNATHATIAVAEFLKIALSKLRSALKREPTAAENLSALMYGIEETIKLILAKDDAIATNFIKPKTTADKDRLTDKMTKKEFFEGLSKRLSVQKRSVLATKQPEAIKPSYVSETATQFDLSEYEDRPAANDNQEKMMEIANKRAETQRERVKERHLADSTQLSAKSLTELYRINSTLSSSNAFHKQTVELLKELIAKKEQVVLADNSTPNPTPVESAPPSKPSLVEKTSQMDASKISMRRSV
jgi:hypothetical protein